MSDRTDNVTPLHPEKKQPSGSLRRRVVIITAAICTIILVAAVVIVAVKNQLTDIGAVRRYLRYRNASSDSAFGQYSYDAHSANRFAACAGGLVVGSVSGLELLDDYGAEIAGSHANLSSPAALGRGEYALVYDIGGTTVETANTSHSTVQTIQAARAVQDADLTEAGAFCYITSEGNYRSVVPVYNAAGEEVYAWYSASVYDYQCALSPDAGQLAVVCAGQQGATFESVLHLLDTGREADTPEVSISLGDQLIYELRYLSGSALCAWGENGVSFYSLTGEQLGSYEPAGEVQGASLDADGFAALWVESSLAGEAPELVTVGTNGNVRATAALEGSVLDMSACGRYVAVLFADRLEIYNEKLERYAVTQETSGASQVKLRADGSAILIASGSAVLYIP